MVERVIRSANAGRGRQARGYWPPCTRWQAPVSRLWARAVRAPALAKLPLGLQAHREFDMLYLRIDLLPPGSPEPNVAELAGTLFRRVCLVQRIAQIKPGCDRDAWRNLQADQHPAERACHRELMCL